MKRLITGILFFVTINCFAVDQKLVDANKQYFNAELKLPRIEKEITDTKLILEKAAWWLEWEEHKTGKFRSDASIKHYQMEIEENQKLLYNLNSQLKYTKDLLNRLEPLKFEYEEQIEIERKNMALKTKIENIILITLFISFFVLLFAFIIKRNYKLHRMVEAGKLTKEEYEKLMQSSGPAQTQSGGDSAFKTYSVRYGWWK